MKKQQYKISQFTTSFTLTFSQIITCEVYNVYRRQQPHYSTVSVKWVCMYTAGSGFTWLKTEGCNFWSLFQNKSLHSYVAWSPPSPPTKVVSFIETVMVQQTQLILVHVGLKEFINIGFVILFHFAMHSDAYKAT